MTVNACAWITRTDRTCGREPAFIVTVGRHPAVDVGACSKHTLLLLRDFTELAPVEVRRP